MPVCGGMRQHPNPVFHAGPAGLRYPQEPPWRATSPVYQRRSLRPYRCLGPRHPAGDRGRNRAGSSRSDGKVTLVGYSLGAAAGGTGAGCREVSRDRPASQPGRVPVADLRRTDGGDADPQGATSHSHCRSSERSEVVDSDRMPNAEREAVCAGHRVEGSTDLRAGLQLMDHDVIGHSWGRHRHTGRTGGSTTRCRRR